MPARPGGSRPSGLISNAGDRPYIPILLSGVARCPSCENQLHADFRPGHLSHSLGQEPCVATVVSAAHRMVLLGFDSVYSADLDIPLVWECLQPHGLVDTGLFPSDRFPAAPGRDRRYTAATGLPWLEAWCRNVSIATAASMQATPADVKAGR